MTEVLIGGEVILLLMVFTLAFAVYVLYHHFGVMYLNSRDNRATQGPLPGMPLQTAEAIELRSGEMQSIPVSGRAGILIFVRAGCTPCHDIIDAIPQLSAGGTRVDVIVSAPYPQAKEYMDLLPEEVLVYVDPKGEVFGRYAVDLVPFGVTLSEDGEVLGKGIPSTLDDLRWLEGFLWSDPNAELRLTPTSIPSSTH